MFPAYPGFENLPLRVEVEWQGRTRPVVARLERWPDSDKAVLVCAFEDDEEDGEWLIMQFDAPFALTKPRKLLWNCHVYTVETRSLCRIKAIKPRRYERLRSIVSRAFSPELDSNYLRVARVFYLEEVPDEPRLVLYSPEGRTQVSEWLQCAWYKGWRLEEPTPFQLSQPLIYWSEQQTREQLLKDWGNPKSDAHFSWQWSRWNKEQKLTQVTGFAGDWNQLKQVMTWVLKASSQLWKQEENWVWTIYLPRYTPSENELYIPRSRLCCASDPHGLQLIPTLMNSVEDILRPVFIPHWKGDQGIEHKCIYPFPELAEVCVTETPTFHEQLEAKLALRDWLQGKATPAQAAQLLASLDS